MSSLIVLKPQNQKIGKGGGLAGGGRGERPAGDERTKAETQEKRKEQREPGGQRASGRERAGKWESTTRGRRA